MHKTMNTFNRSFMAMQLNPIQNRDECYSEGGIGV